MLSPTKHFLRAWLAIPRRAAQKERRKTSGIISANALRTGATWTIKIAAIKIAAIKITRTRSNRDIDRRRAPVPHCYAIGTGRPCSITETFEGNAYRGVVGAGVMSVTGLLGLCGLAGAAGTFGITEDVRLAIDVGSGKPCG
jgi:hypothetical protein